MKKILNKLLPIVIIILYSSCSFEFSEDYYKEIELIAQILQAFHETSEEEVELPKP